MKKLKWYGVLFALFVLFIYIMGIYDLFMMLSHNPNYYESKGYGQIVVDYFTDYPIYLLVFWIGNLICGLLSPLLYLLKNKHSYKVAITSFVCDFILMLLGVIFRNRLNVLGVNIFCFDLLILIITLLFGIYLYFNNKKNIDP
ncbi:MAG: hypothetical protein ACI4M3_07100 [Acutalibacteraceae bacterium]